MSTVRTILERKGSNVVAVGKDTTIREAARVMGENRIGSVVILDGDDVVGIFTERDLLMRVVAEGLDVEEVKVGSVMTEPVACCGLDTPISDIRGAMTSKRIRHIPVVEDGELRGMITSGDILAHQSTQDYETIYYLKSYLYSHGDERRTNLGK